MSDPNLHAVCFAAVDAAHADMRAAVAKERLLRDADAAIGRAVRLLALPGIKRKTLRLDELRDLIRHHDNAHGRADR